MTDPALAAFMPNVIKEAQRYEELLAKVQYMGFGRHEALMLFSYASCELFPEASVNGAAEWVIEQASQSFSAWPRS